MISLGTIKYYPFGRTRAGDVPTDIKFTGQRLDDTGLYYYNARYYDATIGRFISPDTIIPRPWDPQSFNRYSYCLNNPLKYIDPSGYNVEIYGWDIKDIEAMRGNIFYLPPDLQQLIYEIINSDEYQTYSELKQDEPDQIEEMENSDETYVFIIGNDLDEDEHNTGYNVAYFFGSSNSQRYRWNQDPAWWQKPQWQQDWIYNHAEGITRTLNIITIVGDGISFIPTLPTFLIGYSASFISGFAAMEFTHYKYDMGLATGWDIVVSDATFASGCIPRWGIIPATVQLIWDECRN